MLEGGKINSNKYILAIHSTNNYFGFAYRTIKEALSHEKFFVKKFDRDLSNNLIVDLNEFLAEITLDSIARIAVSNGPANFNATRLIIVLARTISQQMNCPLDYYSCYEIMAKRIAIKNNIFAKNNSFWIMNKLRNRGYIAGKYLISLNQNNNGICSIKEIIRPKLFETINNKNGYYDVDYDPKEDLKELLQLSQKNYNNSVINSWEDALPIYPISPIN